MYRFLGFHFGSLLWLFWPLRFLLQLTIQPSEFSAQKFESLVDSKDVIFVLPRMSLVDIFVLNLVLKKLKLPKIVTEASHIDPQRFSILALKPPVKIAPLENDDAKFAKQLASILANDPRAKEKQLMLFPVSVFWGRVPERIERNMIFRFLFPDDGQANALQKIWIILLHCRNVHVHFGTPLDTASEFVGDDSPSIQSINIQSLQSKHFSSAEIQQANLLRRQLLIEFKRERTAALGPILYDFQTMADQIINSQETKKLLKTCAEGEKKGQKNAISYLAEISANYTYMTAEAFERVLDFVWTSIFSGVRVRNFDKVAQVAKKGQVLWMPSHRSHLDYLLLSYLLKKNGFIVPHIAAGVNLNFWPIGSILRRSGAFFLRRSFGGNKIYSHIFGQYVDFLMQNSFAIEFFQEGTRSRIGKLLMPKKGLLSICVSSMIKRHADNTYLIPVYFGYEKVMEDQAYAKELLGAKKTKESIVHFLFSLRKLFSNYGRVDVSFGEPIKFGDMWTHYFNTNRKDNIPEDLKNVPSYFDTRSAAVQDFIKYLSIRVNEGINKSATASGSSILASILLSSFDPYIARESLAKKINILHWVIGELRKSLNWNIATSAGVENSEDFFLRSMEKKQSAKKHSLEVVSIPFIRETNTTKIVDEVIADAIKWNFIVHKSEAQDIFEKNSQKELNLWWYRGTIFHIFCIPGLVATIIVELAEDARNSSEVEWWISKIRCLWNTELFWPETTSSLELAQAGIKILADLGAIVVSDNGNIQISSEENTKELIYFFADLIRPERELYSLQVATALYLAETKGSFSKSQLIARTRKAHHNAFLRGVAMLPASMSEVFGGRVFEALQQEEIFVQKPSHEYGISGNKLTPLLDFFEIPVWKDFLKNIP